MLAITALFFFAGSEWFGPAERHKTESGRTTYPSCERKSDRAPGRDAGRRKKSQASRINNSRFSLRKNLNKIVD